MVDASMMNRRRFLKGSSLAALSAAGLPHAAPSAERRHGKNGERPRHIIHMVADGMSLGTLTCADYLSHLTRGRGLTWMQLPILPNVHSGLMNMRSQNSLVTDSAAASSSWGSGSRIVNGRINTLGDGTYLKTLYELFEAAGWKRALVTTTEITHATPAGFAANVQDRNHAEQIAQQYLERAVDVLLGGGRKFFDPAARKDKRDLKSAFAQAGYSVMETRAQLQTAPKAQRWLGLFAASHLPFTLDHLQSAQLQAEVPTLAEMTTLALSKLERESHFVLQVEGGRVDHACHNCDAPAALHDLIAFDEAMEVCLAFQKRHPETLILATTDHGTGNLGLNGIGSNYSKTNSLFANILKVNASLPEILTQLKPQARKDPATLEASQENGRPPQPSPDPGPAQDKTDNVVSPAQIVDIIRARTGFDVPMKKAEMLRPFLLEKGQVIYDLMNSDMAQLGQLLGNYLSVGWTGTAHTADYVPLTAIGPGAERFRGFIQNTDIFHHYLAMADIDFRNPSEPLLSQAGSEPGQVEQIAEYQLA